MNEQVSIAQAALSRALLEIRGIASQAIGQRHLSSAAGLVFDPAAACTAIYAIADAAHNLPMAGGDLPDSLVDAGLYDLARVGQEIYGEQSPFGAYARRRGP